MHVYFPKVSEMKVLHFSIDCLFPGTVTLFVIKSTVSLALLVAFMTPYNLAGKVALLNIYLPVTLFTEGCWVYFHVYMVYLLS